MPGVPRSRRFTVHHDALNQQAEQAHIVRETIRDWTPGIQQPQYDHNLPALLAHHTRIDNDFDRASPGYGQDMPPDRASPRCAIEPKLDRPGREERTQEQADLNNGTDNGVSRHFQYRQLPVCPAPLCFRK